MAAVKKVVTIRTGGTRHTPAATKIMPRPEPVRRNSAVAALVGEAHAAGLLSGERAEHMSFRAPAALIAAAKRETGIMSTTELGIAALAALAQPDPVAAFLKRTRGRLAGLPPIEP